MLSKEQQTDIKEYLGESLDVILELLAKAYYKAPYGDDVQYGKAYVRFSLLLGESGVMTERFSHEQRKYWLVGTQPCPTCSQLDMFGYECSQCKDRIDQGWY